MPNQQRPTKQRWNVRSSSTTETYFYCWMTAKDALEQARAASYPPLTQMIVAGVFSALTVEAFLNHLGKEHVPGWDVIERKLSPRGKLQFLQAAFHFKVDSTRRPYQTLREMFDLRDGIAHGKSELVVVVKEVDDPDDESATNTDPDWKKRCTLPLVSRMVEDAERIARDLNEQATRPGRPLRDPLSPYQVVRSTRRKIRDTD